MTVATSAISAPQLVPPITAGAYASGAVLGGVMAFPAPSQGFVQAASLVLNSGTFAGTVDLVLFNDLPVGAYADNVAFALDPKDYGKVVGAVSLATVTGMGGTKTLVQGANAGLPFKLNTTKDTGTIYAVAIVRGTPTFGAATDATLALGIAA